MEEKKFCYNYPRPSVTADCILFANKDNKREVMLIKRKNEPFAGKWAFPGGFLDEDETLLQCAIRELQEETEIQLTGLKFLCMADKPDRDPRGRVISAIYYIVLNEKPLAIANDDAQDVQWFNIEQLPPLAFDHNEIIKRAIDEAFQE